MSTMVKPAVQNYWAIRLLKLEAKGLLAIFLIILTFLVYGTLPNRWYHILYAYSGSMQPLIAPGDVIVIAPPPDVPELGMVLTLSVDGQLVTHRLVRIESDGTLITKGDSNFILDDWGDSNVQVVGLYRFSIPYLGYIANLGSIFNGFASGSWFNATDSIDLYVSTANDENPSGTSLSAQLVAEGFIEDEDGLILFGVRGKICVINGGEHPTEGLAILDTVQYKIGSGNYQDYFWLPVSVTEKAVLAAGEEYCYPYEFIFEPIADENAKYRNAVSVTILNHSGWLPGGPHCEVSELCPFGPTEKAEFFLPEDSLTEEETLLLTTATPSATPTKTLIPTITRTATITITPNTTPTKTLIPTITASATRSPTATTTPIPSSTTIPTDTPIPANTATPTASATRTMIPTITPTASNTPLPTFTPTPLFSPTKTLIPTITPTTNTIIEDMPELDLWPTITPIIFRLFS